MEDGVGLAVCNLYCLDSSEEVDKETCDAARGFPVLLSTRLNAPAHCVCKEYYCYHRYECQKRDIKVDTQQHSQRKDGSHGMPDHGEENRYGGNCSVDVVIHAVHDLARASNCMDVHALEKTLEQISANKRLEFAFEIRVSRGVSLLGTLYGQSCGQKKNHQRPDAKADFRLAC